MPLTQTFETTIYEPDLHVAADAFVLTRSAFDVIGAEPRDAVYVLGLAPGIPVASPDQLPSVFFASMAGRVAPFDPGSFGRWERQMDPGDPRTGFARQLAFDDLLPVESSPLAKVSLASLAVRGPAWVIASSQAAAEHPFTALGVVVAGEFGAVVMGVVRGFGQSAAVAAKYHTRRLLKVPTDWVPPEDRP
jgi:hypothetical protein